MNSHSSSEHTSRSTPVHGSKPAGTSAEATFIQPKSEQDQSGLSEAMSQLSQDVGSLKDTFARIASQLGDAGAKTVRSMSQTVASQVGSAASGMADTGSELTSSAKQHAKTFASELEGMARRNPLGTIAGALLVGVIIGMMSRGRS
jgi:ElaB/YqjD/DUF883 family membrane-anchored ribosome-binding protein